MDGYFGNVNLLLNELKTEEFDWSYIIETKRDTQQEDIVIVSPNQISTPPKCEPLTFEQLNNLETFSACLNIMTHPLYQPSYGRINVRYEYKGKSEKIDLYSLSTLLGVSPISDNAIHVFGKLFIQDDECIVASPKDTRKFYEVHKQENPYLERYLQSIFSGVDFSKLKFLYFPIRVNTRHWALLFFDFKYVEYKKLYFSISNSYGGELYQPDMIRLIKKEMTNFLKEKLGSTIDVELKSEYKIITPSNEKEQNTGVSVMTMMYYIKKKEYQPRYNGHELETYFRKKWLYELLMKTDFFGFEWTDDLNAKPLRKLVENYVLKQKQISIKLNPLTETQKKIVNSFYSLVEKLEKAGVDPRDIKFIYDEKPISLNSLKKFEKCIWINDECIDAFAYLFINDAQWVVASTLITKKFLAKESDDYYQRQLRTVFKKVKDYGSIKKVFFPVNVNDNHWILIVLDFSSMMTKQAVFMQISDSLESNPNYNGLLRKIKKHLESYLKVKINSNVLVEYKSNTGLSTPTQINSHDCGVSVLTMMYHLKFMNEEPQYTGEALEKYYRNKWLYELLMKLKSIDKEFLNRITDKRANNIVDQYYVQW